MEEFIPIQAKNGRQIRVRFLTPADGDLLLDLFFCLSPETRYQRFHVAADVSAEEARLELPRYLDVDQENHVALLALVEEKGRERAVAVARFQREPGSEEAEGAVVVRDDWQRQGIGSGLFTPMLSVARQVGIKRFVAWVQGNNRLALRLVSNLGLPTEHSASHGEDFIVIHLD